jgi:hypothetical protein
MKQRYATILLALLFGLLLASTPMHAETASASHGIHMKIGAAIVLYVDDTDRVIGLFHIAGSRDILSIAQIDVRRSGTNVPITAAILLQYAAIEESADVDWLTTGYYLVSYSEVDRTYLQTPVVNGSTLTISQGDEGREITVSSESPS